MTLNHGHVGHAHFWERAMTRRNFIGAAAVAGGAAATAGMWLPQLAKAGAFAEADPRFIPGGTMLPFAPDPFHFFFPTDGVPGAVTVVSGHGDPSLITDFDGMIGVADVGQTTGTDGAGKQLLWKADVRFMTGTYLGTEGDTRTGAFAFVWLDIYTQAPLVPGNQVHDFNPGVNPFPHGLFWTMPIPPGSVQVDLEAKIAALDLSHAKIDDYGNVVNALTTDHEIAHATIDVELRWHGGTGPTAIRDATNHFTGEYVTGNADLKWSAQEPGFEFVSDQGHAEFARIGHERNGVFFT